MLMCCIRAIKRKLYHFLILIFVFPALLYAGEPPAVNIVSLQEVLENITRTDPSILEAYNQYQSVLAERSIATSEYYPTVGTVLSTGPERTNGVTTNDKEENLIATNATLFARQNLYNGGKTTAFVEETDARIKAAAYEVLNAANTVYLDTAEAYINVVKARELLQIAKENSLTQERIMRQVREKTEAGFNRMSELYNSESRLALSKASYISRQQDLNQALVTFHRQFGRFLRPEQFIKPEPTYVYPQSVQAAIDVALHTHPALKVAKYNIETRRYTYKKSSAADYPMLDFELFGRYTSDTGGDEGNTNNTGAFLTLSYTFFDGGLREGNKARDQQSLRKEYQRGYVERRNVNESIRLAWNIKEAEEFKNEYLREHVLLSAKTLDAFKEEYYVNRRSLLDLLNMENEYTDAQISMVDSQFLELIALYRMMQGTGELLEEHDTGIRRMLNLPLEDSDDMEDYTDLGDNRDKDQVIDIVDQCDNSELHSSLKPYGCKEDKANTVGYPYNNVSELSPYITPAASQVVTTKTTKTKFVLEAQPDFKDLTDEGREQLTACTALLISHPEAKVLIEGYVASDKNSTENIELSLQRANNVKQYFLNQGINENRITVKGRGNEDPIADNNTRSGREMNRRVEVSIIGILPPQIK
jgi:outer membrane protein, adhesin transport system